MNSMKLMPALPFAVFFVLGIAVGYYVGIALVYSLLIAACCVIAGFFMLDTPRWRLYPLLLASFFVGMSLITRAKAKLVVPFPEDTVELQGVVTDKPRVTEKYYVFPLRVKRGIMDGKMVRCYIQNGASLPPILANTYRLRGRLSAFENFGDSNFDYKRWGESHSFTAQFFVYRNGVEHLDHTINELPFLERVAIKAKIVRERLLLAFADAGVQGSHYAIMSAMAFGDKSAISRETQDVYALTGTVHLLALSGMHLGILFMLLSILVVKSRRNILGRVVVIASIWGYVILVGMPASVVRAATMLTIYSVCTIDGREAMSVNALFITAVIMLSLNPMIIWDAGFQLSFLAMLSIFIYYAPLYNIIPARLLFDYPVLRKVWSMSILSLAAQIGTAPLTAYYFGRFSTYFLLTNIIAIPLVTLLLYSVAMSLLLWFIPFMRVFFIYVLQLTAAILNSFLGEVSMWSGVSIENISINWMQLMLIYLILAASTIMSARIRRLIKVS